MKHLKAYIDRQSHRPGLLGVFINPFFLARRGLYRAMRHHASTLQGKLLDIGCGTQPYRDLFQHTEQYIGLELDTPDNRARNIAETFYDGRVLPFADNMFDSVLCNQVLEHVFEPGPFLSEIHRVLKPGGKLLLTVPFVWDEHEQPRDFARYTSFGLSYILDQAGFEIIDSEKIGINLGAVCQLFNAYWYKCLPRRPRGISLISTVFLMSPVTLIGLTLGNLLPANPDLYLDNLVVAQKR